MAKRKNDAQVKFSANTKDFNEAIKKANKELTKNRSELKLNAEMLKAVGECTELLEEREKILQKELVASKDKTKNYNDKLEQAKKIFGENSDEVSKLTVQLNNAKTMQQKIQNEINSTNQRIEKQIETEKEEQSMLSRLISTINEQENSLERLKNEYADIVLSSGKYTKEAKQARSEIAKLNVELDNNKKKLKSVSDANKEAGSEMSSGDGYSVGKGIEAELYADAGKAAITSTLEQSLGAEASLDKMQAKIGSYIGDIKKYQDTAYELYEDGMGESFDDVVNTIAVVRQQMGELNEKEMKDSVENALMLSDIFDMDVLESTRAAKSLMKQFNVSQEEAYNLIVQGAQNGLNQNGDLLDIINEYSVQFKNAGYSADNMFNMLANGVEAGTWSVDKLGDAIKEMNIRFSDGTVAEGLKENRKALGYTKEEVNELQEEFNKGGTSAQKALQKVMNKLSNVNDDTLRYQVGVSMFGTMWEDLGEETVNSLINTQGEIKRTNKAINSVKTTAYDNAASSIESVKRTLQDVGAEIVEDWQPEFNEFAEYISDNADEVANKVKVIGGLLAAIYVVKKGNDSLKYINDMRKSAIATVGTIKKMILARTADTAATTAQTVAQTGLNTAMNLNVFAIAATSAIILGAAIYGLSTKTENLSEAAKKAKDDLKGMKEGVDEANESVKNQFETSDKLIADLDVVFDKNGKVKKGYEDRAKVIQNDLKEAYGIEIDINKQTGKSIDKLKNKIEKLTNARKADAYLEAHKDNYLEAYEYIQNNSVAYAKDKNNLNTAETKYNEARAEYERLDKLGYGNLGTKYNASPEDEANYEAWEKALENMRKAKSEYDNLKTSFEVTQTTFLEAQNTVARYEGLQAAQVSGDAKKIDKSLKNMENSFISYKNASREMLTEQVDTAKEKHSELKEAYELGTKGITQQMVDDSEEYMKAAIKELNKYDKKFFNAGENHQKQYVLGWGNGGITVKDSSGNPTVPILNIGTSLPPIKKNADGNIVKKPILTTFAEKGWEAAIPINNKPRSRALWFETGKLMGMFDGRADMANVSIQAAVDMSETNALLRTIAGKDFSTYLNGRKVSEGIAADSDVINGTRVLLAERGCAYE